MSGRKDTSTPPQGDPLGVAADAAPTDVGDATSTRHGAEPPAGAAREPSAPDKEGEPQAASGDAQVDEASAARGDAPAAPAGASAARGDAPADDPAAPGDDPAADPLADAQAEAAEMRDRYLRSEAELQNVRKRAARDVAAAHDRGVARLAKELLTAFDHLELALAQAEQQSGAGAEWVKGIRLVQDELHGALARVGIQAFSPTGEPFDPNEHEAMAQQPSEEAESGTVLQVYQQGYRLNGQVLRPARVVVAGGSA